MFLISGCAIVRIKSDFTLNSKLSLRLSQAIVDASVRADSAYASRSPIPRNYISVQIAGPV